MQVEDETLTGVFVECEKSEISGNKNLYNKKVFVSEFNEKENALMDEFNKNIIEMFEARGNSKRIHELNVRNTEIIDVIFNMRAADDKTPIRAV